MKAEDLYEAIGEVSEELLEESEEIASGMSAGKGGTAWREAKAAGETENSAGEAENPKSSKAAPSRAKILLYRRLAVAAAAVLVLGAGAFGLSRIRMGSSSDAAKEMKVAEAEEAAPAAAMEETPMEEAAAEETASAKMEEAGSAAPALMEETPMEEAEEDMGPSETEAAAASADTYSTSDTKEEAAAASRVDEDTDPAAVLLSNVLSPSNSAVLLPDDGKNHVVSPVNISMALSLLAETTTGETQKQILNVLGVSSPEELRGAASAVLANAGEESELGTELIGNSLWLRDDGTSYNPQVQELLEKIYGAQTFTGKMGSAEYNDRLHKWLDENNRGLLKDEANAVNFPQETMLALASTLYYKANWVNPFNVNATQDRTFHAPSGDREVPFLSTSDLGTYYRGEHFGAVNLPLTDGKYFWLILPDEGYSIADVTADRAWLEIMSDPYGAEGTYAVIHLKFPKFDASSSADLSETLQAMGINDVFDAAKADFSPLLGPEGEACVSKITHAARATVDENGVTAAAFTVVMAEGAALPPDEEIEFVCDRPFVFAVADREGLVYFEGAVAEP